MNKALSARDLHQLLGKNLLKSIQLRTILCKQKLSKGKTLEDDSRVILKKLYKNEYD